MKSIYHATKAHLTPSGVLDVINLQKYLPLSAPKSIYSDGHKIFNIFKCVKAYQAI